MTAVTIRPNRRHLRGLLRCPNFVPSAKTKLMTLHLFPEKTLGAAQTEFGAAFPGLKLAFFSQPHHAYEGSAAKLLVQKAQMPLGELAPDMKTGQLLLEPTMPTWQVERLFEEEYGLHVQVFRRSGNLWLESSVTDDLSLEAQQAKARASEHVHQIFVDPMDYREQD
jgi:hypothetical protein